LTLPQLEASHVDELVDGHRVTALRCDDVDGSRHVMSVGHVKDRVLGVRSAVGETELESDPGFQSALRRVTARVGLTLGLDTVDRAISRLGTSPAAATGGRAAAPAGRGARSPRGTLTAGCVRVALSDAT